jgi:DNA-binding LacI/PurR family transcriptional regulator
MSSMTELIGRKPKNVIIADAIRGQINSGVIPVGERLLSDDDFARKYKVNKRTVAAGLNALVKEGLLERIPRRGTFVIKKDSEGHRTSNAVGMIMYSKGDVYSNINRNITRKFTTRNLYPILISDQVFPDDASVKSFMQAIVNDHVMPYGFLIDGSLRFPFEFLKQNIDKFHNIVFINKYHHPEKIKSAKYVLIDFAEAGRLAAKHFIVQGHKKLTCLAMPELNYAGPWCSVQVQIMQGFAEVCQESNVQFNEEVFWKLLNGAPLTDTVTSLLSSSNRPDAIFSYNDFFIRSEVLPLLGNDKDIELIGFYNTHHAEECNFSSICIHEEKIAKNALELLANKTTKREVLIKPELIVRSQ